MSNYTPKVEILADSVNTKTEDRITTYLLHNFPKCLLAELNTHRALSRNTASSRAIPVEKVIEQVMGNPYIPDFTANQRGMVGKVLEQAKSGEALSIWLKARDKAVEFAGLMRQLGIHKQDANRILEPWMLVPVVATGTDWKNLFEVRCAPDAQPAFRDNVILMRSIREAGNPQPVKPGGWHIPFSRHATDEHRDLFSLLRISAARCARTSYLNHEGKIEPDKDFNLHDRLITEKHPSPLEHQDRASFVKARYRNLEGWMSYRMHVEHGIPIEGAA